MLLLLLTLPVLLSIISVVLLKVAARNLVVIATELRIICIDV